MQELQGFDAVFSARLKRMEALIRKVKRLKSDPSKMEDIVGLRVVVGDRIEQDRLCRQLERSDKYCDIHDYTMSARSDGYRAAHIIVDERRDETSGVRPVEIQVRTYLQHLWASLSEVFGQQVKEGGGSSDVREMLRNLSERIADIETNGIPISLGGATGSQLGFQLLHFDTRYGRIFDWVDLGRDIDAGVRHLMELEGRRYTSSAFEAVLLCSRDRQSIEETHIRYFPRKLAKGFADVAGIALPDWALKEVLAPARIRHA